jgi:hypothetical protein
MKGGLTRDELAYLRDLASLDRINLGMLYPSVNVKKPEEVCDRLVSRGLARVAEINPYGDAVIELTTKGHRTLRRVETILARV